MNGAEMFAFLSMAGAAAALAELLAVVLIVAVLLVVLPIRWNFRRRRQLADETLLLEEIAQEIAYCYGHGPIAVMDPQYQHEFRRDARAALKVMRGRK